MSESQGCPVCGAVHFELLITVDCDEVEKLHVFCCHPNRHIIFVPEKEVVIIAAA